MTKSLNWPCYYVAILPKFILILSNAVTNSLISKNFAIFSFGHKKSLQTARMASIYYALQQLTMLLYQQHMLYTMPVPGQWPAAHQLIECAIDHNFYQSNINQVLGTQHQIANIAQAYAQLILLDIFNNNQIRPAEIQGLYLCSYDWAKLIQILPKETTLSRYIVDAKKDHPPVLNAKQNNQLSNRTVYISTQSLLEHLTETQTKNANYLSKNAEIILNPCTVFPYS